MQDTIKKFELLNNCMIIGSRKGAKMRPLTLVENLNLSRNYATQKHLIIRQVDMTCC
ncbi:hypothetical protein NIES22_62710 [Calothrix brevissima NIES-22]|nr:hypothetical protein NIES22_62710 [Calothrix brevissima NIES-22]